MSYYKSGTHINFKKKESLFVRLSNAAWPYIIGVMAAYGFIDFILTANGF